MTSEDQNKTDRIQQLEKRIEELENKQQLSKYSRRGLLGGIAGVAGLGAMSGSGAAASGQVGTANNRVNVFADTVDANSLTGSVKNQGCRVFLSSEQNISQSTRTKIQFDNKVYDSGNNFDTSSHDWTCPEDGLYAVNLQVSFLGGGNGETRVVAIGTGTTSVPSDEGVFTEYISSDTGDKLSGSTINRYSSGDTIAAYVENRGSNDTVQRGSDNFNTFFEVAFLGGL